ncbi:MAG: hypothetical protein RIQ72_403 [Candidatus Parcubacteria bacterium]
MVTYMQIQSQDQDIRIIFSKTVHGITEMDSLVTDILSFLDEYLMSPQYDSNCATVIALHGDLGAGKTTFTQLLAKRLGVQSEVNSPTFTIMKRYTVAHTQFTDLIHIDAYRLAEGGDLKMLGIQEVLQKPNHLFCIEWPDIVKDILPRRHIKIEFEHIDEGSRKVTLSEVL